MMKIANLRTLKGFNTITTGETRGCAKHNDPRNPERLNVFILFNPFRVVRMLYSQHGLHPWLLLLKPFGLTADSSDYKICRSNQSWKIAERIDHENSGVKEPYRLTE
jgi:hypothetical protein